MRRSVSVRNCGGKDKKSTTKAPKLRSSSRIIDQHLKGNMPVYNIIARRHKVNSSLHKLSCHYLFHSYTHALCIVLGVTIYSIRCDYRLYALSFIPNNWISPRLISARSQANINPRYETNFDQLYYFRVGYSPVWMTTM